MSHWVQSAMMSGQQMVIKRRRIHFSYFVLKFQTHLTWNSNTLHCLPASDFANKSLRVYQAWSILSILRRTWKNKQWFNDSIQNSCKIWWELQLLCAIAGYSFCTLTAMICWYAVCRVVFSAMMLIYLIWCVHVSLCRQWCHFSHAVFLHVCLPICCACPHIFLWARRSAVESFVVRSALAPAPPCPPGTGSHSVTIVLRKCLVDC